MTAAVPGDAEQRTTPARRVRVFVALVSERPPRWVAALLLRIACEPRLHLHAVRVTGNGHPPAPPTNAAPGNTPSVDTRLARFILHTLIDRPRFDTPPDTLVAWPEGVPLGDVDDVAAGGDGDIDVMLDIGTDHSALVSRLDTRARLWSARTELLTVRVERALLEHAPLFWLHLWEHDLGHSRRLASHALPRQSFSVSDLTAAAFLALPALFVSRLVWLAEGHDPLAMENASLPRIDRADGETAASGGAALDTATPGAADTAGADGCDKALRERQSAGRDAADIAARDAHGRRREAPGHDDRPRLDLAALGGSPSTHGSSGRHFTFTALSLLGKQTRARLDARRGEERWQLGVTADARASVLERFTSRSVEDWTSLAPPPGQLWADPHLCRHEGRNHLYFEEMPLGAARAHIAAVELDDAGYPCGVPRTVLRESHHLSYPFVFVHEGRHYMLPESVGSRTVSLYTSDNPPGDWRHERDLLVDIDVVDSTLHHHDGLWWLFTNRFSDRVVDERDELLIFFADALDGPWTPHPLNPVVTGVDRARMAGAVFAEDGHRYRPSQYGAVRYGHGLNLARIEELSTTRYRETPIRRLVPAPDSPWLGCHSLSSAGPLSVIDRAARPRWRDGGRTLR